MNLNSSPTVEQLRDLLRPCDDYAGHHILWVAKDGAVRLSRVPKSSTPAEFVQKHPDMQIRFEMFLAGNEYVGAEAADDMDWVTGVFDTLLKEWSTTNGKSEVTYIPISRWVESGTGASSQEKLTAGHP